MNVSPNRVNCQKTQVFRSIPWSQDCQANLKSPSLAVNIVKVLRFEAPLLHIVFILQPIVFLHFVLKIYW